MMVTGPALLNTSVPYEGPDSSTSAIFVCIYVLCFAWIISDDIHSIVLFDNIMSGYLFGLPDVTM